MFLLLVNLDYYIRNTFMLKKIYINKPCNIATQLPVLLGLGSALLVAIIIFLFSYFVVGKGRVEAQARAYTQLDNLRIPLSHELNNLLTTPEIMALFIGSASHSAEELFAKVAQQVLNQHSEIISIVLARDNVIHKAYPLEGNESIIGMHYLKMPDQAPAVQRAIDTRLTVVAGPLALKQGGFGVSSRTPVYVYTPSGIRDATTYWGIVSLTINADWLLHRSGFFSTDGEFDIAVRGKDGTGKFGTIFSGQEAVFDNQPVTLDFVLPGGGLWEFAAVPKDGWPGFHSGTSVLLLLAYALSFCIGYLIYCLTRRHQQAIKLSTHDALTGLCNRAVLLDAITKITENATGSASCGALCVLDLDSFKPVNDHYGHVAGDKVLQVIAERLLTTVGPTDIAVRLGGDEFAILVKIPVPMDMLCCTCTGIITALKAPISIDNSTSVVVGCSMGATPIFPMDADIASLLERADKALYASKNAGKGKYTIFDGQGIPYPV